jgi:hypothetical protein
MLPPIGSGNRAEYVLTVTKLYGAYKISVRKKILVSSPAADD